MTLLSVTSHLSGRIARLTAVVVAVFAWTGQAQSARPSIEVRPTDRPPIVDGQLDDACWREAAVLTDFTQVLPVEGAEPTEQTEVRFTFDANSLFVAIRCLDSNPNEISCRQMRHDNDQESDDSVQIAFDTFELQHDGYFFAVNPAGARAEGLIENFFERKILWDTVWSAKARIDDRGWTAELAIPFKSLSFNPANHSWGCNVERVIRRKQEVVRWTAISRAKAMTTLSDLGQLRGLTGMRQGLGLEVKPYARVQFRDEKDRPEPQWAFKAGGDLTYNLTPSLKANATVNTDFAEAEVDDRVVNLSRFPVFFPEKRDFFLQDSSLFSFGGLVDTVLPYYSRRVGLGDAGQPVDLLAGTRLTGRVGNTNVAVLDVEQDESQDIRARNLLVARASTQVLAESDVGLLGTAGDPRSNGHNALAGADFNYRNSRLAENRQIVGHAWVMGTTSDRTEGQDLAFGGDIDYPNEPLDVHLFFRQIGEDFDPGLGFVEQRGVRQYIGSCRWMWRPNTPYLRTVSVGVRPKWVTDLDHRVILDDHELCILTLQNPAGDQVTVQYTLYGDAFDDPFEIVPGLVIPPGRYRYAQLRPSFKTSPARCVAVEMGYRDGDFYGGTRRDYKLAMEVRPSRYITAGVRYELRQIRLPEGTSDVRIAGANLLLAATPDLSWDNRIQYDNVTREVGLNSRLRWTYRPASDLFLVVNQGADYDDGHWRPRLTDVQFKVTATIRF